MQNRKRGSGEGEGAQQVRAPSRVSAGHGTLHLCRKEDVRGRGINFLLRVVCSAAACGLAGPGLAHFCTKIAPSDGVFRGLFFS